MNSELKKTVIIGSGNLAEALARAVAKSELELVQIFARNAERARVVAELAATGWETRPEMLRKDADIYLIAVSDRAVAEVAATLPIPEEAAVAHTAGSVPVTAIPERFARRAVFYPMQTFTRGREADFSVIPVFLEAPSPELRPERSSGPTRHSAARCISRRFSPATSPITCMPWANVSSAVRGWISTC